MCQNQPVNFTDIFKDPKAYIQNMALQNPEYAQLIQKLNSGIKPEQIFRDLCTQRGIDPDKFLSGLNIK